MILFFIGVFIGIFIGIWGLAVTETLRIKMKKHTNEEIQFIRRF